MSQFDKFSLKIPGGSRFQLIESVYASFPDGGYITPNHPKYELVLEAQRDVHTLAFVFENADGFGDCPEFRRLLRSVVKDSALPQSDIANSDGRNDQFHLYVAAICAIAGMKPQFAEPDIQCVVGKDRFGIAVKRIKNAKRLKERVKEAAEQIQRAELPGIIAADVGMSINHDNLRPDIVGQEDSFAAAYLKKFDQFAGRFLPVFSKWLKGTETRGLILHDSYVTQARHGDANFVPFAYGIGTVMHNYRREKQFVAFRNQYNKGFHKLKR